MNTKKIEELIDDMDSDLTTLKYASGDFSKYYHKIQSLKEDLNELRKELNLKMEAKTSLKIAILDFNDDMSRLRNFFGSIEEPDIKFLRLTTIIGPDIYVVSTNYSKEEFERRMFVYLGQSRYGDDIRKVDESEISDLISRYSSEVMFEDLVDVRDDFSEELEEIPDYEDIIKEVDYVYVATSD